MKREQDGAIITQFDYPMCESLGLVKMDFLGLRNLTVLDDALDNIRINRDETVVLEDLPFDDPATYELLSAGDTLGVFQLDGGPMRALLRSMRPDKFDDISAVGALYRPGPMGADSHNKYARRKNGREPIDPIHPELAEALEPVLGETYGLIVYQEQVMAIAQVLAGFTLGQADNLRRAMGKKKKEELDKQYAGFQGGMLERGFSQKAITTLWEILLPFSDYAFNKAHSAAYGVVSYWTAYLKANYPAEYMAALLTSTKDDKDKSAIYLNECRRMKIQVLPPDVNESQANFTPVGNDIRFGLTAIRNVGRNVVDQVVAARAGEGPVRGLRRLHGQGPRAGLQQAGHRVADQGRRLRRPQAQAPRARRDPRDRGRPVRRHQAQRGDRPGLALRRHGRRRWRQRLRGLGDDPRHRRVGQDHPARATSATCSGSTSPTTRCSGSSTCCPTAPTARSVSWWSTRSAPTAATVTVSGLVTSVQRKITKKGDPWAMVTLEDLEGAIEVLLFPSSYQLASTLLMPDAILTVKGRLSRSKEQPELHGQEITVPDLDRATGDGPGGDQPAVDPVHAAGRGPAQGRARLPSGTHRGAVAPAHP